MSSTCCNNGASAPSVEKSMGLNWKLPQATTTLGEIWEKAYPLKMYNSITRSKSTFVPISGRRVLWYMCGPTVYDSAHMGHARTYLTFDILRRIMVSYFNYDVVLCMNITDIDDKIIIRSNEAGIPFEQLAREQETSFMNDMKALGVGLPDVLTRVSEYVPEIVSFIEKIISNGFAYVSGGSVYFDTKAYRSSGFHVYGKLVPENVGNSAATEEGEGSLSASVGIRDKRDPNDFALWKASKPGEPFWTSPWGEGRPGWHIECSAMCAETLGKFADGPIDIHSGGIDLRFPHHENEIAQSEACFGCTQWVNYFLHSGHLSIDGLKMSKSLKNFIKISDAIEKYGARALRLLFLQQRYSAPMSYSESHMEVVASTERLFTEFFDSAKNALRQLKATDSQKWHSADLAFATHLTAVKTEVRAALADDFDTGAALHALQRLAKDSQRYILGQYGAHHGSYRPLALNVRAAAEYVTDMMRVFGLVEGPGIGWSSTAGAVVEGGAVPTSSEEILAPVLDALCDFREAVRTAAKAGDTKALLGLCDGLRDLVLPPLGIKLEDQATVNEAENVQLARWKLRSPAELMKEAEEKRLQAEEKARKKAEAAAEAAKKAAEKEAKARVPASEMFKGQTDLYSKFDEDGVPTHAANGEELEKSKVKNLKKEYAAQLKLNQWLTEKEGKETAVKTQ